MVDPVLKWAGGKRQLLDELHARLPAEYGRYYEPFVGGGALFFDLEPATATINDANPRLVNTYEQVRSNPTALIERLRSYDAPEAPPDPNRAYARTDHKGEDVSAYYYQQRALFNKRPYTGAVDPLEEAALLCYLNRTCYNGLYRENSRGGFNVPIGRYADPDWVQADRIRAAARVLAGTQIRNDDFTDAVADATAGDLVYCDPPYEPMSTTASFTDYSAAGFDRADQRRLLETAQRLDEKGVWVVLSNSGVMYEPYTDAGFDVEVEGATRAINSDAESRGAVDEIIATNVPPAARQGRRQTTLSDG